MDFYNVITGDFGEHWLSLLAFQPFSCARSDESKSTEVCRVNFSSAGVKTESSCFAN